MLFQVIVAGALQLPHGLAEHMKSERPHGSVNERLDLEFYFSWRDRFVAQSAELPGSIATPQRGAPLAGKAPFGYAITRNGTQFCFKLGQLHGL